MKIYTFWSRNDFERNKSNKRNKKVVATERRKGFWTENGARHRLAMLQGGYFEAGLPPHLLSESIEEKKNKKKEVRRTKCEERSSCDLTRRWGRRIISFCCSISSGSAEVKEVLAVDLAVAFDVAGVFCRCDALNSCQSLSNSLICKENGGDTRPLCMERFYTCRAISSQLPLQFAECVEERL